MKLKRDLFFALLVVAVVGILYFLSTKTKIKPMPVNASHLTTMSRTECMQCHTAEALGALEVQHKHPGKWKDQRVACTLCHKPGAATKAEISPRTLQTLQLARSLQ